MTVTYGGYSFEEGKRSLDQAREEKESGQNENARSNYNSAINTFKMCGDQHSEAESLLAEAEREVLELDV